MALTPFASWPYAMRAPQCVIETWARTAQSPTTSYLVTARGFRGTPQSDAWLRLRMDPTGGAVTQHWRRVVAKPFGELQDDACGVFIIDATGLRSNRLADGTAPLDAGRSAACWAGKG